MYRWARGVRQVRISGFEAFMFNYFGKDSPVIPGGVFITTCIPVLSSTENLSRPAVRDARPSDWSGSCCATAHARRAGGWGHGLRLARDGWPTSNSQPACSARNHNRHNDGHGDANALGYHSQVSQRLVLGRHAR